MHKSNQLLVSQLPAGNTHVIAATSFGFALVQLDVTIVNVALPSIADSLRTDTSGLQWVVDAYALAFSALLLSFGALVDRIGGKRVYRAGLVGFALASLACGLATDALLLILLRALQGVAACRQRLGRAQRRTASRGRHGRRHLGALAGDYPAQIVSGLARGAALSSSLLLMGAMIAWRGMRPPLSR